MLQSMTGFSTKNIVLELSPTSTVHVTLTLKSLNSRFFEANCKLPYVFSDLETELIKRFKARLHRGSIFFTIHVGSTNMLATHITPVIPLVKGYLDAVKEIKKKLKVPGTLTIKELVRLPNIFEVHEESLQPETRTQLLEAVEGLINELLKLRAHEGQDILRDIESRLNTVQSYFSSLETKASELFERRKEEITQLLRTNNPTTNDTEPSTNLAIYTALDKIDIHEEITRFKSHLTALIAILHASGEEKGKKIDFTLQELFREINTITAKCCDALISRLAINIKVELEKIREQVQNIV